MTSLTVTRTLAASPARVWRSWTDAAELSTWLWPPSFDTTCEIDLQAGGRFRISSQNAGMAVGGEYLEIDEPSRLVFTWRWDGEEEDTLVTVTFEASGSGTVLGVRHERFTSAESCASHEQGWNDCLDRLPAHLAS
ncbi:SRPBCC family protein [Microbacterium pygmaeum]|uniref:Uncharacterized conserved protein YndB, AHSA1/START domain n=1 Tax=Microbacterium pygmaeum TaxID=370764 RepID=A0A1G7WEP8_9MICO|nr:SRPBCC domain-containing protein [Microbacterium pygmaeum]SDG70461.1 Uncharacterized conserved protein YndB, AHSA1/START domain [Microbacterium pygmaeum]